MTTEEMQHLQRGDIVKHQDDSRTFVVTGNYGGRVTAVATVDITNPPEWEIVQKADQSPSFPVFPGIVGIDQWRGVF